MSDDKPAETTKLCIRCRQELKRHCKSKTCTWGRCADCKTTVTRRGRVVHDNGHIIAPGT